MYFIYLVTFCRANFFQVSFLYYVDFFKSNFDAQENCCTSKDECFFFCYNISKRSLGVFFFTYLSFRLLAIFSYHSLKWICEYHKRAKSGPKVKNVLIQKATFEIYLF